MDVRKIFLTGHCSLHWGRLENGNIGNYYLIDGTFKELHRVFPEATVITTFQMTETFLEREPYVRLVPMELYHAFDDDDLSRALEEYAIASLYAKTGALVKTTPYIDQVLDCDLYIDLSGEMWGYHADVVAKDGCLLGILKNRVAQLLGKPTAMMASSQGRFFQPHVKQLAKETYEAFDLVANREAETQRILAEEDGFDTSNTRSFACPAFLFEPAGEEEMRPIFEKEKLFVSGRPTVAFTLCGFNMLEKPYDKWPRDDADFLPYVETIEHIIEHLGADVVCLSHSNGFELPPHFKLIPGRDYPFAKKLYDLVTQRGRVDAARVKCIKGPYNPWQTKAIIGHCDMLVTGRLHASVAGTSQCVPTVVIMHGHGQPSHKTKGFFDILQLPDCIAEPGDAERLIAKVDHVWTSREDIRQHLQQRMPAVRQLAHDCWDALKTIS